MEIGASTNTSTNPNDNFQTGNGKLSNLASVAAATTLGQGDRAEQITSVLSSSLIVLDNLDTIDAAAFGHSDSKRSGVKSEDEARGSGSELAGATNADSINIRISSDSDLDTESYFSDFNIKRFSSKRGNGNNGSGGGGGGSSGDN